MPVGGNNKGRLKTIRQVFRRPQMGFGLVVSVATVFLTPSGKNTKTQIKPFGYCFRQSNHSILSVVGIHCSVGFAHDNVGEKRASEILSLIRGESPRYGFLFSLATVFAVGQILESDGYLRWQRLLSDTSLQPATSYGLPSIICNASAYASAKLFCLSRPLKNHGIFASARLGLKKTQNYRYKSAYLAPAPLPERVPYLRFYRANKFDNSVSYISHPIPNHLIQLIFYLFQYKSRYLPTHRHYPQQRFHHNPWHIKPLHFWAIPSLHNARPICLETLAEYLGQRLGIQEGANRRSEQILK